MSAMWIKATVARAYEREGDRATEMHGAAGTTVLIPQTAFIQVGVDRKLRVFYADMNLLVELAETLDEIEAALGDRIVAVRK